MGEQLKWAMQVPLLAVLAFHIVAFGAEHIAYERALVREQRVQCPKADAVSLFKGAHRCDCEAFDSETFGGRPSILFYEEGHD